VQRRHDLIPNLVEMVKGYRDYERQLQSELAALRGELMATPPGVARPDYRAGHKSLGRHRGALPGDQGRCELMALQKSLVETEQRIALARGYFNDIATHYNTRLGDRARALCSPPGRNAAQR